MRALIFGGFVIVLAACAAGGPAPQGTGRIYALREAAAYASEQSAIITLDSRVAGALTSGHYLALDVPSGHHVFGASDQWTTSLVSFDLDPGATVYFDVSTGGGLDSGAPTLRQHIGLQPKIVHTDREGIYKVTALSEAEGEAELAGLAPSP
jgi:hypothetical protein